MEAPKWQHLSFLSWYMQIFLHRYLDLATGNTEYFVLLIPWPSRKSSGKCELAHVHNNSFNKTMHYWPNIWLHIRIYPLVHFYVTQRFSTGKCLSTAWIFYEKNNHISSAYNLSGSNCSKNDRWLWLKFCPKFIMLNCQGYLKTTTKPSLFTYLYLFHLTLTLF